MDALFSPALLSRLSAMVRGEQSEPESPQARQLRLQKQSKMELLAKSQRAVILEDLEHAVRGVQHFLQVKNRHSRRSASAAAASELLLHEESKEQDDKDSGNLGVQSSMMESTDDQKQLLLNDDIGVVNVLCTTLDRCVNHGLRAVESDVTDTVKFFGVVKWTCTRVDAIRQKQMLDAMQQAANDKKVCEVVTSSVEADLPRHIRGFLGAARAAASLTNVQTDEGKARAFIRQALNMHVLKTSMGMILSETNMDLLSSYYSDVALFRQRDDVKIFLHLLTGLDELAFAFLIDDRRLDQSPDELPFSTPLPRLKAQKIKKKAPKLIDPEDMVGGRVRLCEEDEETNILAEKLVSHHELRSAFNSLKGGNPLSDILKKAAQSQKLEDAAVAVLRFLELGYPEYDVFGTELLDVLCNPFLSGMARFETALGVPDVIEAGICHLFENIDTPGLFQVHLHADHVMELRDTIEELGGFHKQMSVDPHEVTAILYQYLWELPDALLTAERLDNFLACGGSSLGGNGIPSTSDAIAMDHEEKKILLKVLVNDLPWYCKPLLERLCHLVTTALEPQHAEKNGLSLYSIANCLAPLLLRKRHAQRFHEYEDSAFRKYPVGSQQPRSVRYRLLPSDDRYPYESESSRTAAESRAMRHATRDAQESAQVLSLLLQEQAFIFCDFREEMSQRREKLKDKVLLLESLRFKVEESIDTNNPVHVVLLKRLWDVLVVAQDTKGDGGENENVMIVQDNTTGGETVDVKALIDSARWRQSGFHTESPLGGFRGGGLLSLECLIFFLEEYPQKAKSMMIRNALPGGNRYPFPVACINVMRMMLKLLMLDEAPEVGSKLVMHSADPTKQTTVLKMRVAERVSRTPFWHVFDDHQAFFKLHSMAFMLLDLHWIHSGATQMGFQPVLDATRRQMGWLLEQAPQTVEEMWTKWMEVREQHATKFTPIYQNTTRTTTSSESDELVAEIQRKTQKLGQLSTTEPSSQTITDSDTAGQAISKEVAAESTSPATEVDPALAF
ncbi:hypothetical protein Poli38472_004312 [Pythium oligandrum]|uniref:Rho-GAP domain-containing protein n=1 Tax=Pythium oligandrum TaxID=41045 RepID=A0A8K1CN03_PYTOL|nr:hypothetical protein Poli38472_004312 [Pythium oligandrum]|eukprot:TMW66547.1 hypothetical protein Poli38472_004312 [Pythium oligandrum]